MQILLGYGQPRLLAGFPDGSLEGRFPVRHFQLSADRTPATDIGLLGPFQEKQFAAAIAQKYQDTDFEGEHGGQVLTYTGFG